MFDLTKPIFTDKNAARKHLERLRWANGRFCPHCGEAEKTSFVRGKKHRPGLYYCNSCKKQFTVTVGTLFERSKVPLHKWMIAYHLMAASKKGISAHQLHRMLGVTYKTAWFMAHRIREAMREINPGPLGGEGKAVEVDETYIGGKERYKHRSKRTSFVGGKGKEIVFSLIERGGRVHSHHVPRVSGKTLRPIIVAQVDRKSTLMTDEAGQYRLVGHEFARHGKVNHGIEEYVRGDAHVNSVENYFSILKRGITGTYHHISQQHLKRYLAEFDFRYNERSALEVTDEERAAKAIKGAEGKRLTYQQSNG